MDVSNSEVTLGDDGELQGTITLFQGATYIGLTILKSRMNSSKSLISMAFTTDDVRLGAGVFVKRGAGDYAQADISGEWSSLLVEGFQSVVPETPNNTYWIESYLNIALNGATQGSWEYQGTSALSGLILPTSQLTLATDGVITNGSLNLEASYDDITVKKAQLSPQGDVAVGSTVRLDSFQTGNMVSIRRSEAGMATSNLAGNWFVIMYMVDPDETYTPAQGEATIGPDGSVTAWSWSSYLYSADFLVTTPGAFSTGTVSVQPSGLIDSGSLARSSGTTFTISGGQLSPDGNTAMIGGYYDSETADAFDFMAFLTRKGSPAAPISANMLMLLQD